MVSTVSNCFLIAALFLSVNCLQAQTLTFDHGKVDFYTSSILSDIEATSEDISVTLDISTGDVEISIPIESFEFEYEMMQDHFNEEYMESDQFPNATFTGKIGQDISDLKSELEVDVAGILTIHGIQKETSFKATLSMENEFTLVKCKFPIIFKDFNVEEPAVLSKSLAKDVELKSVLYLK